MQRTSIFILATLLAVPAADALAKDKGHGKGHAKHANKAEKVKDKDNDGRVTVRERAVWRNRDLGARQVRAAGRHGLDRNGDGIITRAEWRGNAHSFDVQDRNNDGVISARDRNYTAGRYGANARYGDWRTLDRDADGSLERWEWPHGDSLFNDIDRNNDGRVSQWELRYSVR
jgi:hypothetical protein